MDTARDEITENVEDDRLSILPDELIQKILSYISIKHVVQTSALSSRWRYIWTSMPYLNFSAKGFRKFPNLSKFVTHLLSGRNNQTQVISVSLTFRGKVIHELVQRILDYAFSHNVQQLNITYLPGYMYYPVDFPTWVLPTLTTLSLTFYDDACAGLLSNCTNLKNLTLKNCKTLDSFSISHPRLSSLTLENGYKCVNVTTPQLKNLTIKNWRGAHVISAPNLSSLHYTFYYYSHMDNDNGLLQLPTDLRHMEKVNMCIDCLYDFKEYTCSFFCLLQQLHCVKFLTLNLELVKLFSSLVKLISDQASPFVNLKSLKFYPARVSLGEPTQQEVTMSTKVKNYFLGGSPGATFTPVSYKGLCTKFGNVEVCSKVNDSLI
ncbi:FBD-associated F-box protein At3g49020-like [Bidens hawaiensis]|uniref:FBD-associated F-box protein At3g49020-like n=1 Tax=Bidens hawaiensis TaxID=980011 RepID=UPI00404AAA81